MVALKKCALCPSILNHKNKTQEHIIPNAIGGRKKTTGFICNTCNNTLGESWDAELARQLNWFSLAVGISRDRGAPPRQIVETIDGDRFWQSSSGTFVPEKPSYSETDLGEKIVISMTSQSMEDARRRLMGVARKYPKFDVQKALDELEIKTSFLESPLHVNLSLGGPAAGRSLVKTAFAFASECGIAHEQCEKAVAYLLDESSSDIPFGYTYLSDLVESRPQDHVFHCVSLHANPKTKRVYSYLEYFGLFRVIVLLGQNYEGPFRNECYSINPIDGDCAKIRVVEIEDSELEVVLGGDGFDQEKHKAAADYAFQIIMKRTQDRTLKNFVREGFEYAGKKLGLKEGDDIPREKAAEFTAFMMEKLTPYIEHLARTGRSNTRG